MQRIVLTGGPGAGKTVISRRIVAESPDRYVLVPEAATQVYDALQTRWDRLDDAGRRDVQRRIYRLQVQQEDRISREHPGKILLLDRGTIDGAAYWPEGPQAYWDELNTSAEAELSRYSMIIWLETCAALNLYDGHESNPRRFESPQAAIESGELLLRLWERHPNLHRLSACESLEEKFQKVREILSRHP
jgi:predicted ATPase